MRARSRDESDSLRPTRVSIDRTRLARDRPRFNDTLDVIKFICKEFWTAVFRKQVDNLKTNHKGVYVLTDNQFRWFLRMSTAGGMGETVKRAFPVGLLGCLQPGTREAHSLPSLKYLAFPCGLIRGALANLGIPCTVLAETSALPSCTFQIKIPTR